MQGKPSKLLALLAVVAVFALFSPMAAGKNAPKASPKGSASQDSRTASNSAQEESTEYTEDTDTNDGGTGNNQADEGDNAHPSGKDRSVEHGGSGNQGKAQSDPDDDTRGPERTNGGVDQPNGPGGRDLADQDGNNGCGNDDDFEDDNEGWCMGRPGTGGGNPIVLPRLLVQAGGLGSPNVADEVLGKTFRNADAGASADVAPQVLPSFIQNSGIQSAAAETLPLTGSNVLAFVLLGAMLILIGAAITREVAVHKS